MTGAKRTDARQLRSRDQLPGLRLIETFVFNLARRRRDSRCGQCRPADRGQSGQRDRAGALPDPHQPASIDERHQHQRSHGQPWQHNRAEKLKRPLKQLQHLK
jgi:hypothetical protein